MYLIFITLWLLLLSPYAQAAPADVVEKAKAEGKLVWWGGGTESKDAEFINGLNQKNPFITVEQWNTSSKARQERVWAEFTAKKYSWDVVTGGGRAAHDWVKAGIMQKWSVPGLSRLPAESRDPNGYYAAFGFNVSVPEIGRASCRERVEMVVGAGSGKKKNGREDK